MPNAENVWLSRGDITDIEGALKPGAYVARAYLILKETGQCPPWARKGDGGRWQFSRDHICRDAQQNLRTIGISEAADRVGTSRRTIQTWFDEGVLEAFAEERPAGESRRIDRAAFIRALPDLKTRLTRMAPESITPRAEPSGEVVLPQQVDERSLSKSDRRSLAALRKRIVDVKARRESVLKDLRAAQKAASSQSALGGRIAARIDKLRKQFEERLNVLSKSHAYADRKQAAEEERAQRLTLKAQGMLLREAELVNAMEERLALSKRRQAQALSQRLEQARQPDVPAPVPDADAVERVRLANRKVAPRREMGSGPDAVARLEAERIAESLVEDIDSGVLDRIDAAILFNTAAEKHHIPNDVRIAVTRDYFSRG